MIISKNKMKKILFVCSGNTCRSPMAENLLKFELKKNNITCYSVSSAGFSCFPGMNASNHAIEALSELGITEIKNHKTKYLSQELLYDYDYIICMTSYIKNNIQINYPQYAGKLYTLKNLTGKISDEINSDISDPFGGTISEYTDCRNEIHKYILQIIEAIKKGEI